MTDSTARKLRVLLFSTVFPSFVADDEAILRKRYRVDTLIASGIPAVVKLPLAIIRNDVVVTWFGSVYSALTTFLSRLLGRVSIIIVGGVDASREPEVHYGIWLHPLKRPFVRYAFRHADRVLVVDPSLGRRLKQLARYPGDNIHYLPTGYDPSAWPLGERERERLVLAVASCDDERRLRVKGIDKFFNAARQMPDISFRLVGIHPPLLDRIRTQAPPNVEILPYVPRNALASEYQRAKVYCQPSFTEGLPNTLCEAMLCGCIPVGTIAGGIPTAIGDTGYLVDYRDQQALVDALRDALNAPISRGHGARQRIESQFTVARRAAGLYGVIDSLASRSRDSTS